MNGVVMRALSIRQPWAELILRGVKTVEYRSRPTRIVGERFWIYASKGKGRVEVRSQTPEVTNAGEHVRVSPIGPLTCDPRPVVSDLSVLSSDNLTAEQPPRWLVEMAAMLRLIEPGSALPTGVIVGSAVIERVSPPDPAADGPSGPFRWHLTGVERADTLRKPHGHPQPAWFRPF